MKVHYKPICCLEEGHDLRKRSFFRDILYRFANHIVIILIIITLSTLYLIGIFTYFTEEDFASFNYPKEITNLRGIIGKLDEYHLNDQKDKLILGINNLDYNRISETIEKINIVDHDNKPLELLTQFKDYNFNLDIEPSCERQWGLNQVAATLLSLSSLELNKITIVIIVKSAVNNYLRRHSIRESWYLNNDLDIFKFKTVFIVGKCHERNRKPDLKKESLSNSSNWSVGDCEEKISTESRLYGDIIQSSGIDSYYNNTIKTFMTYKWVTERCPSDFILTLDDDYVFEVDNFISYLYRLPHVNLPLHLDNNSQESVDSIPSVQNLTYQYLLLRNLEEESEVVKLQSLRQLSQQFIWAGFLRNFVHPLRIVFSKWYITQEEYAYDKYPPFVTGGAVLMSFKTVKYFYYATYFTNSFKFDDVYVGITAYKLGIPGLHSDEFMCNVEDYLETEPLKSNATSCIGVHDIESTKLIELWNKRKEGNNARG